MLTIYNKNQTKRHLSLCYCYVLEQVNICPNLFKSNNQTQVLKWILDGFFTEVCSGVVGKNDFSQNNFPSGLKISLLLSKLQSVLHISFEDQTD